MVVVATDLKASSSFAVFLAVQSSLSLSPFVTSFLAHFLFSFLTPFPFS